MEMRRRALVAATLAASLVAAPLLLQPTQAAPKVYKNCTELNKVYKHGVGKKNAKDKTSGTPVTTFTRKGKVYKANKKSDRDKDGIACEKR